MWTLKYLALVWAANAPAPKNIPLGGNDEKMQLRRYFSSLVLQTLDDDRMLVETVCYKGVSGLYWEDGEQLGYAGSLQAKDISGSKISITHYFKEVEIAYGNAISFLWGRITFRHRRILYWTLFRRWTFGMQSLEEASQIEVLKWCQQKAVYQGESSLTHWDFLSEKYGTNWIHHPQKDSLVSYYRWIMQSLCATGDLKTDGSNFRYSLEPKAISTIVQFDADSLRHTDSQKQHTRMSSLTSALVFVAFAQLVVAALTLWSK